MTALRCPRCASAPALDPAVLHTICPVCRGPLLVEYDTDAARATMKKDVVAARAPDMWRYRELLPVRDDAHVVTLGEGCTPLLPLKKLGKELGLPRLHLKDEGLNPTGEEWRWRRRWCASSRWVGVGDKIFA